MDVKNNIEESAEYQQKNRSFRVKSSRKLLDEMLDYFLENNPDMSFPDVMELALLTFFQRNSIMRDMLKVYFAGHSPNMLCIEQFRKRISRENGSENGPA